MMKRRDLLKIGGAASALLGLGSLSRLLGAAKVATFDPITDHDYILEFRPDAALARSPQLQQALHKCMQFIVAETRGKILPVLSTSEEIITSEKPRIQVALSSPSLKSSVKQASLSFFSRLPQGLSQQDKRNWLTSDVGMKLWQQAYAGLGLKPLYFGQGPSTEYQLLSRSPEEILNVRSVFLTKNKRSLHAQFSKKEIIAIHKYQKIMISHHLPFETDAIPAVTILEKDLISQNLLVTPSHFLSSSVFEMNLLQKTWDHLPQDIQNLLVKVSFLGGDELTALFNQKEAAAVKEITLTENAHWQLYDFQKSQKAYGVITHANAQNIEIAKIYESFRKPISSTQKIS